VPASDRRRLTIELPWRTLLKVIAAVALVWLAVELVPIILLVVVAVLLAVTLNPVVCWVQQRGLGLGRAAATTIVTTALLLIIAGFLWLTWTELASQADYVARHFDQMAQRIWSRLPGWIQDSLGSAAGGDPGGVIGPYLLRLARSTTYAIGVAALGFFLMIYLLIEGRETYEWLLAFVAREKRPKVQQTVEECERVVFAYVAGNVITSIIATAFTLVLLLALNVPAALLLALVAGLSDFVPVIGFIVSLIPAAVLALTVSPKTLLLVVAGYIAYNAVETYLISPWAYGDRMKLSNVVIILAFAVGAEVAGVIGALIALPIAAIYPSIERIWLKAQVGSETVREHRAIERKAV
jgi:predicted PurR-regulated permease PerM